MNTIVKNQEKLFFIIGISRSGTSLLQEILNTFSGTCHGREARIGPERISCYSHVIKNDDFSCLEDYIITNWINNFYIEKTPNSILCLPQLHNRYPKANYLFLERNPLKIILSQMNFNPPGKTDEKFRRMQFSQGFISGDDLKLNYEQMRAKILLDRIKAQVKYKSIFKNQITIRYENLVNHLDENIMVIQNKFKISSNLELAKKMLSRPSYSSKKNRYALKKITDKTAIKWIKQACTLWNYNYNDSSNYI